MLSFQDIRFQRSAFSPATKQIKLPVTQESSVLCKGFCNSECGSLRQIFERLRVRGRNITEAIFSPENETTDFGFQPYRFEAYVEVSTLKE